MASAKAVIIIGKPGVGKSTIGNKILGHDLFEVGADYEQTKTGTSRTGDVKVYLINTISAQDEPRSRSHEWCKKMTFGFVSSRDTRPEEHYRSQLPQRGSLVIFVFKQERFTEDTKAQFEAAISALDENASKVSALVITCCEGKTQEAKESIIKDFKTNRLTEGIAKFMEQGIYCVGFPDKMKIPAELSQHYTKDIEHSQEIVKSLVTEMSINTKIRNKEIELHTPTDCNCNVQ